MSIDRKKVLRTASNALRAMEDENLSPQTRERRRYAGQGGGGAGAGRRGEAQTDLLGRPIPEPVARTAVPTIRNDPSILYSFPGSIFNPAAWRKAFGKPATPPPKGFEILADKKGLAKAVGEIRAGLAPTSMRGAKPTEYAIRAHNANRAQAFDQSFHALEQVRAAVDRLSKEEQVDFSDRMESGERNRRRN